MTHDSTNQEGFERWAERQRLNLSRSRGGFTVSGLGPATYRLDETEHAWRGWANRPHRETRVEMVSHWPTPERKASMPPVFEALYGQTPVQPVGVMGIPPNPPGSGSAKATDALTWNVRTDGGDMTAIHEAAARASAEMPEGLKLGYDLTARVDHIDDAGYVHWKFPKVADTAYVGAVPGEYAAEENFRRAVRALVDKLPKDKAAMTVYFAREELRAVRKLLGDEN